MLIPDATLYPILVNLLGILMGPTHATGLQAISALVWALLVSQSLHPADLARALPDLRAAGARQAMRRVRRALDRTWLMSKWLTPHLIKIALRLVGDRPVTLVLDSTRCLCWELFTLGIVFHGRVLPIAWAVLPYPWPQRSFTPTVIALLEHTMWCWPYSRPVHLVADRGFPSLKLFRRLEYWRQYRQLGYTIRLRAGDWVRLPDSTRAKLAELFKGQVGTGWTQRSASYCQRGKASPTAMLVIGRSEPEYPKHQRGPADQARREARAKRRRAHLRSKGQANPDETDQVWALLTTAPTIEAARGFYELRSHTEGTYRDLKAWGLEAVASHETDKRHLDGLVGLAVLGYFIQASIGAAVGRATAVAVRARQRQWTTADRLSVFWRGRQVLHDRAYDWRAWLRASLSDLTHQLAPVRNSAKPTRQLPLTQTNKEAA